MSFALDDITERGLPVDIGRQNKLRAHIEGEETRLLSEIQKLVPEAVLKRKLYKGLPKNPNGYKVIPKEVTCDCCTKEEPTESSEDNQEVLDLDWRIDT